MNASAALVLSGVAIDGRDGLEIARAALADGAAEAKSTSWVDHARHLVGDAA